MEQPFPTAKRSHTALCLALLSPRGEVLKIRPFLDNVEEQELFLEFNVCVSQKQEPKALVIYKQRPFFVTFMSFNWCSS